MDNTKFWDNVLNLTGICSFAMSLVKTSRWVLGVRCCDKLWLTGPFSRRTRSRMKRHGLRNRVESVQKVTAWTRIQESKSMSVSSWTMMRGLVYYPWAYLKMCIPAVPCKSSGRIYLGKRNISSTTKRSCDLSGDMKAQLNTQFVSLCSMSWTIACDRIIIISKWKRMCFLTKLVEKLWKQLRNTSKKMRCGILQFLCVQLYAMWFFVLTVFWKDATNDIKEADLDFDVDAKEDILTCSICQTNFAVQAIDEQKLCAKNKWHCKSCSLKPLAIYTTWISLSTARPCNSILSVCPTTHRLKNWDTPKRDEQVWELDCSTYTLQFSG